MLEDDDPHLIDATADEVAEFFNVMPTLDRDIFLKRMITCLLPSVVADMAEVFSAPTHTTERGDHGHPPRHQG